jgi:hypothetical protein
MKHQLDATLCRFYFCRVTLHVSGASTHRQEYLKLVRQPLVHVLSLQVSQSLHLLIRAGTPALMRCDDLPATITHVPVAAVLVLNTPDDGRLRLKHVSWFCRNKTCTVLHQVGVSFDLYCDARKHKIKIYQKHNWNLMKSLFSMLAKQSYLLRILKKSRFLINTLINGNQTSGSFCDSRITIILHVLCL